MTIPLLAVLLPVVASLMVVTGGPRSFHRRVKLAAWPIGLSFVAAILTLVRVANVGPIRLEFAAADGSPLLALPLAHPSRTLSLQARSDPITSMTDRRYLAPEPSSFNAISAKARAAATELANQSTPSRSTSPRKSSHAWLNW